MLNLVKVRDYLPEDKNFIYASWLRNLYYSDAGFKDVPKDVFMKNYHDILERILNSTAVKVKVACLNDDESVILGYSVLSEISPTLYWVFVKAAWRRIGIAKSLVPSDTKVVTHLTAVGRSLIKKHPGVVYNPFIN
jgi:hypothetical protein